MTNSTFIKFIIWGWYVNFGMLTRVSILSLYQKSVLFRLALPQNHAKSGLYNKQSNNKLAFVTPLSLPTLSSYHLIDSIPHATLLIRIRCSKIIKPYTTSDLPCPPGGDTFTSLVLQSEFSMESFRIGTFNDNGINIPTKQRAIFQNLHDQKLDFCFLQETHSPLQLSTYGRVSGEATC